MATSSFFFLSSYFYPLAFYCLFSLLTLLASRDFCENVLLVHYFSPSAISRPHPPSVSSFYRHPSSLCRRMPGILKAAGFKGTLLEILCTFCKGLESVYKNLLQTPHELTGDDYEVQARIHLGFQAEEIFGTGNITTSLKQIVTYVPYYQLMHMHAYRQSAQ